MPVSSVQRDISSIAKEYVAKFKELANNSIQKKEFVKSVMRDTQQSMENVQLCLQLLKKTQDVLAGKVEYVFNAQKDGILTKIKSVFL